ncbi:MAG: hypothetical protein R3C44_19220 [Chloroflexota bacterium]
MLRRTHPQPADAMPMLREKELKKYTQVYTSDGQHLGVALRYFHRSPDEVDPGLRLYRTYLEVQGVELGGSTFIPTEYIASYDPAANRLELSASLEYVEDAVWNRKPDFVARGQAVPEELP